MLMSSNIYRIYHLTGTKHKAELRGLTFVFQVVAQTKYWTDKNVDMMTDQDRHL